MEFLSDYRDLIAFSTLLGLVIFNMRRHRKLRNSVQEMRRKANLSQKTVKEIIPKITALKKSLNEGDTKIKNLKASDTDRADEISELKKAINHRALARRVRNLSNSIDLIKLIPDKFVLINNAGQSNAAGRGGERQSEDAHNALCLKRGGNGEDLRPLSIENSGQTPPQNRNTWGNCPMFGFAQMYQQLLMDENALDADAGNRQLILVQTAQPAKGIDALAAGSQAFSHFKRSITRLGDMLGPKQQFHVGASLWTQGEQDCDMSRADYAQKLIALAQTFNDTAKGLNTQRANHVLLTWQVCSTGFPVALAQLDASAHPQIYLSGPSYQFDYEDDVHLTSRGLDGVGALYGLAWKRLYVDKTPWEPLRPVGASVFGKTVILSFNKGSLEFDTDQVPEQPDFGFSASVKGTAVPLDKVTVINGNQVKITFKKTIPQNTVIAYGATPAVGKGPYLGGAGNLRDKQGEVIKFGQEPLHNWCVLFEWQL